MRENDEEEEEEEEEEAQKKLTTPMVIWNVMTQLKHSTCILIKLDPLIGVDMAQKPKTCNAIFRMFVYREIGGIQP
jgi:hypothetical protein